jgi:hypothetical protein
VELVSVFQLPADGRQPAAKPGRAGAAMRPVQSATSQRALAYQGRSNKQQAAEWETF